MRERKLLNRKGSFSLVAEPNEQKRKFLIEISISIFRELNYFDDLGVIEKSISDRDLDQLHVLI